MLDALARWAAELQAQDVPTDVMSRARLLHLSLAGALRRAGGLPLSAAALDGAKAGPVPVFGSARRVSPNDATRAHAAMAAGQDFADTVFNSPAALGAVCVAWSGAEAHTLDQLLVATVAGIEAAARVGAAALLSKTQGDAWGPVHAVSAAVARAKLAGLGPIPMGNAIALALAGAAVLPRDTLFGPATARGLAVANEVSGGVNAAERAAAGASGSMEVLESRIFAEMECSLPLHAALGGAGSVWYTRASLFKPIPGAMAIQVPVQSVHELLRRHVRAAEKRLRTDQVERITLRVAAPGWASAQLSQSSPDEITRSIARSIAALITAHELGSTQLDPAWRQTHHEVLADLEQRVEISHSWAFTVAGMVHLAEVCGPLFAGASPAAIARAMRAQGAAWPSLPLPRQPSELLELARVHPERILLAKAGDISSFNPASWRCPQRVEVKLYTTRGGWWPERRENPDGVGWDEAKLLRWLDAKWAGEGPGFAAMGMAGSEPGEAWIAALRGA